MVIIYSVQTTFSFTHIEGITLGRGKAVDETEGASGIGVDRVSEVVTGLLKDRLLDCMGLILQRSTWQG